MAKNSHCGGPKQPGPKTVPVLPYRRSKPGPDCYGGSKPGPKTVHVKGHKRSRP